MSNVPNRMGIGRIYDDIYVMEQLQHKKAFHDHGDKIWECLKYLTDFKYVPPTVNVWLN